MTKQMKTNSEVFCELFPGLFREETTKEEKSRPVCLFPVQRFHWYQVLNHTTWKIFFSFQSRIQPLQQYAQDFAHYYIHFEINGVSCNLIG